MLGFIVGAVIAIGVVKMLRRRGYCAHGHGAYGTGYGAGGRGWRGFGGPRWWLRSLFERLGTTPGQEKAILGALDDLRASRAVVRDELKQTRAEVGQAISSGLVDDATLEDAFARHDRLLAQLRVSFVEALKKVTEVLDEQQRRMLAGLLQNRGWFGPGGFGGDPHDTVWA